MILRFRGASEICDRYYLALYVLRTRYGIGIGLYRAGWGDMEGLCRGVFAVAVPNMNVPRTLVSVGSDFDIHC